MGQSQAMPLPEEKLDVVCDIFSQGLLYSTQKVKAYLGFRDPEQKLRVSTSTLDEIFLVHFISFCQEKGVGDRIVTCKMSRCQQLLLGVDWIWTISGSDRSVRLQIAVQTVQMNESFKVTEMDEDPYQRILEKSLSDLEMKSGSRFDKLIDFSSSIGWNCIGLCIVYGLPGKPKEMKGVLSDSVSSWTGHRESISTETLQRFLQTTDYFITTKEMLENYLHKRNKPNQIQTAFVNFL